MNPPRTRSLWLAASASAGASRSVGVKRLDQRMAAHGSGRPRSGVPSIPPRRANYCRRRVPSPAPPDSPPPLVRGRDGELHPAPWDDALDRVVAGLARVRETHGPAAFGMFSCSKSTNETNYAAQKFARAVMGSNNIDSCNRT